MTILRDTNSTKRSHSGWDICVRSTEECALPRASALLKILSFWTFQINQRGIVTLHRNVDTLWKKPFCLSFPPENSIAKDWKSSCWYQEIFPATHGSYLHSPWPKIFLVPGRRPFAFTNAGKVFRSPEWDILHSSKSGLWREALPSSRDQNFPALGNAKGFLPKTFPAWGRKKSNSKDIMLQHS